MSCRSPLIVVTDGEWVRPIRKGWRMTCCTCGQVHRLDFKLVKKGKVRHIEFRATRVRSKRGGA